MRTTLFALVACFALSACATWPSKQFTEAKLYRYNAAAMPAQPFVRDGRFTDTIVDKAGVRLSPKQVERVFTALRTERPRSTFVMLSLPQHAIVFYDARQRPVGVLELDLSCLSYTTYPRARGFAQEPDFASIADVCGELRVPPFDCYSTKEYRKNFESMVTPASTRR
jgi:hypothetical protein